jgi:hypothetical protein
VRGPVALDTSVAVPLLVRRHTKHALVMSWWVALATDVALAGHALAETYSVLTRLPGGLRVTPEDAVRLLERLGSPLTLGREFQAGLVERLGTAGIGGGAVYDGLVALAADEHGVPLATRDLRARDTYERLGVRVMVVA